VPNTAHWRLLNRLARMVRLAHDVGQAVQVLDALAPQDVHQLCRADDPQEVARFIDLRHDGNAMEECHRGHQLLIRPRQHTNAVVSRRRTDLDLVRQRQQFCSGQGAEQPSLGLNEAHQIPTGELQLADPRAYRCHGLASLG
jgi:hypothetical protein